MKKSRFLPFGIAVLVVLGFASGCSRGPSEQELKLTALQEQLATIQQQQGILQKARADLAAIEVARAELDAVPERRRSEEQKTQLADLQAQVEALNATKDDAFEQVQGQLAGFLNIALNEFPEEPITLDGLRIYADEAILIADEVVAQSGDYKKAIDQLDSANSYFTSIGLEPYQPLTEHIAHLSDMRFITKERFDMVEKGMTKDEAKAIVGVPYYQNIQEDPKRGIETWLYRKREGGAAALYFKMKTGKVYNKSFEAVKTKVVTD
ncbi:MAG: hypothetical protein ACC742_04590 [Thermoanaerobaculales bacterium]